MQILSPEDQANRNPSFFPPLFLQRRAFILSTLKRAGITSCVEIGCGEGQVLTSFCQPASCLDALPASLPTSSSHSTSQKTKIERLNSLLSKLPPDDALSKDLHLKRIVGLDVDLSALQQAVKVTAPHPIPILSEEDEISGLSRSELRWEPLKVELWQGSLDVYNGSLMGYEAFVATEVVEHLPDGVLSKFGRVILGRYRPRIAIITTPDYDFRPHFPKSDKQSHFFPDPTKRTDRIFRHSDHLFEWTGPEFRDWCDGLAKEHDYSVEYSGVGDLSSFKADTKPTGLCASQCVVFTANEKIADEPERSPRSPLPSALPFFSPDLLPQKGEAKFQHKLVHTHTYPVVQNAGKAQGPATIRAAVQTVLERMGRKKATLRELWARAYVSKACGGSIKKLLEAVVADDSNEWSIDLTDQSNSGSGLEALSIECSTISPNDVDMDTRPSVPVTRVVRDPLNEKSEWPVEPSSRPKLVEESGSGWD